MTRRSALERPQKVLALFCKVHGYQGKAFYDKDWRLEDIYCQEYLGNGNYCDEKLKKKVEYSGFGWPD